MQTYIKSEIFYVGLHCFVKYESSMHNLIRHIVKVLITFCLVLISMPIYPISYSFRSISETDGLSDLMVSSFYKDSLGYVWIGTASSVERFDGVHLKHYPVLGNNEKLKWVNVITETAGNKIWVGNDMGLWIINKETEKLEPFRPATINCGVRALLPTRDRLYIGSEKGLFIYRNNQLERIALSSDILSAENFIVALNLDENGILWILTKGGLHSMTISNQEMTSYPYRQGFSYRNMTRIGKKLYLGTMDHGLLCFDSSTGGFKENIIDLGCNVIMSLSSDEKNLLYIGTDGNGVHFVSANNMKIVRSFCYESGNKQAIRSNSVYALLVDREGVIWIGFYQLGLDYTLYQSGLFSTYAYPPYFDSKGMPIRAIAISKDEKLIGSRNGLFYIDEGEQRFKSFKVPELRSNMILCIYAFEGKYYIGTYGGGIYVLNPSTLTLSDFETADLKLTPFLKGHVFSIKSDDKGDLWMATSMGLYCYRNGQQIRHYTTENSKLPGDNVYDICFDSTRKGWICTENGLCLWDPSTNSLKSDVFPEGFIHKDKIRTVYEDSDHELYFLPDKGAVFISDLSMNHFRRMQSGTPLDGKDAMFIVEDHEGWLWIGTNLGLYRYDKKNNFVPYNFVDGLPSSIFITCFPVIDEEGTMWFGNSKGLIYLTSEQDGRKAKWHYPIAITDVLVNGKQSVYAEMGRENNVYKMQLEAEQRNLTIRFSGFTYSEPIYMSYICKMEGIDGDWQLLSGQSEITYYDLSSGNYQFRIHRVDDPESEICLMVTVAPRFNAVMWSVTVLVILIITLAYIYYRRRMKRINLIQSKAKQQPVIEEKYRKSNVTEEECRRLAGELELLMQRERLYVNPNLKIVDLAAILNVSTYTLSYLFNQYLDKNYYDYLNDYRIEEFKRLVDKDEYSKYTLTALAELCGFSSRTSFFRYFKKVVGITPNEYIRSIGKTNEE